jgi:hypothetical protein
VSDFILGVDLDGVCGDHAEAFRRVVAEERGVDLSSLPPQETWDFTEWDMDRAEFERLHRLAVVEHRMFRTMPVIPGAAETLWRLSDAGVWIRLITHRLYTNWGHAVAVADTVEWLDHHSIPYRDLCPNWMPMPMSMTPLTILRRFDPPVQKRWSFHSGITQKLKVPELPAGPRLRTGFSH